MALWDRFKGAAELVPVRSTIDIATIVRDYDLVDADTSTGVLVVAERPKVQLAGVDAQTIDMRELGMTGATNYAHMATDEYNWKLRGKPGLRIYDEMRRSDGQIKAVLRLVKTPVLAAHWYMQPASQSAQDVKIAEFVWNNLTKYMSTSFPQLLTEILLFLDYGYYNFEKVWDLRDRKIIWKKFAPRHPLDVEQWLWDQNGGPQAMVYVNSMTEEVVIPIDKLLVFTNEKEAGNILGISVLRPAYKHWYYKDNLYKIDAIAKERHGIGIPIIKLPPNFNDSDKRLADEMGKNLRTNEKAHIVLPPQWEILMLKLEGHPVDALKSVEHHNHMILSSVLAGFMDARSARPDEMNLYTKAASYIADIVRDVFNKYAIPQLVDFNWRTVTDYPELRVRRIGETVDWRTISFAIRNLVGAGIIVPDDNLEKYFREELDLPIPDPATSRQIATPQLPGSGKGTGQAGLPRQSTAAGNTQGKTPGSTNIGQDKSGGR